MVSSAASKLVDIIATSKTTNLGGKWKRKRKSRSGAKVDRFQNSGRDAETVSRFQLGEWDSYIAEEEAEAALKSTASTSLDCSVSYHDSKIGPPPQPRSAGHLAGAEYLDKYL